MLPWALVRLGCLDQLGFGMRVLSATFGSAAAGVAFSGSAIFEPFGFAEYFGVVGQENRQIVIVE